MRLSRNISSASRYSLQLIEVETYGEMSHEPIFFTLHFSACSGGFVIKATQMKHSMNDVANEFSLPCFSKARRLNESFVETNEYFSSKAFGSRLVFVVECDDVRRTHVSQKTFIHSRHCCFVDNRDADFKFI